MKKRISLLLCVALIMTTILSFPAATYASTSTGDLSTVKEVTYGYNSVLETGYYSDDLFKTDAYEYNLHLAILSNDLVNRSCINKRVAEDEDHYADMDRNLREYLLDNGFVDYEVNEDYKIKPTEETTPVACAHKKITANGKTYTLLVIEPKGGATELEWMRAEKVSEFADDNGDYAGYRVQKDTVLDFARSYVDKYGISGDVKVWISGLSRSAAIVNLTAAELINDPKGSLGDGINLAPKDLYCYCFGTPAVVSPSVYYSDSKYNCIHNFIESDDFIARALSEPMGLGRYGQIHTFKDGVSKDRMMELLGMRDSDKYEAFINGGDPDAFSPLMLDTEALRQGEMKFLRDENSYLPYDQAAYFDSIVKSMHKIMIDEGLTGREGFYNEYQEASQLFMTCYAQTGIAMEGMTSSKMIIPSTIMMYMTYVLYKAESEKAGDVQAAIESTFNALAAVIEDENGNVRQEYRKFETVYRTFVNTFFKANENYDGAIIDVAMDNRGLSGLAALENAPQRYSLRKTVKLNSLVLKAMKKLSGKLFALSMIEIFADAGADADVIDRMTSSKNSEAMAFMLANLYFGNGCQSAGVQKFSLNNEYFKQFVTFLGNTGRYRTDHEVYIQLAWLRAADSHFDDYTLPDAAQSTGYRRVFIKSPAGVSVTWTVTDTAGNTVATVRDGVLLSRTDEWIGVTTCDTGNWLRLPLDKDYKIDVKVSKDAKLSLRVADYSAADGKVARTVNGDGNFNWTGRAIKTTDTVTLNVPAAECNNGVYDLTSAYYSLRIDHAKSSPSMPVIVTSTIPKAKGVKATSASKSITVKWTKLSAKQRKKFDKIEVQYSTSSKFTKAKTVRKELAKTKTSLKVNNLKKGTKYYVRVRNIKYSYDKKKVSKWSAVKKVTVK